MVPAEQADIAAFLERLAGAKPVLTHISAVFIGAEMVWKLKLAVRLPFLDFTTIDARHRFLCRELALNAPAAPGLYRDVVPVVRHDGDLMLGEAGKEPALDWVLRMARVPPGDFLDVMARENRIDPPLLDAIADSVAAYHARLSAVRDVGQAAVLRRIAEGNVRSARAAGLPEAPVTRWHEAMQATRAQWVAWLAAREADGFVRRGHGDLHLGNLCLWQGRPVPFDALEFDETLATLDLGYDIGFLLMDLDRRVGRRAANRVLNRYVARTGDAGLVSFLHGFLSMRALIRSHVEAARGRPDAAGYLDAACAYLVPAPAPLVAIGGLQGTGKSTLARDLAPGLGAAPGALILRSDEWRKHLAGVAPEQHLPAEWYEPVANARLNAALRDAAERACIGGHAVIVDQTFLDPAQRAAFVAVARRAGRRFRGIWLEAPLPMLEARLASRRGDASDATVAVLRRAVPDAIPPDDWQRVDATDRKAALAAIEAALAL